MNVVSKPSQRRSPKRRQMPPSRRPKPPATFLIVALVLGYSGLIAHCLLSGSIAFLGIQQILSGGLSGWLLGLLAIAVSLVSTITAIGVIFIPYRASLAFRLMIIAGFSSLALGLILLATGSPLLPLAGIATACFWIGAVAIANLPRQRPRRKRNRAASPVRSLPKRRA
ncbi:hypothetical protein [Oscillatoria sp. FACHB-1406]|uniref:hypothetical protein n=1 Tax=Oscillatoria sp. FACHB-1406 TaxID=2692846 RepID=UPI00168677A5|nr:hypothetical protein [Oscillatoria sp. FACHB-1406]MBD2577678.1 hypothetical protein [Oscillatoria sp. FACHB-1406]